LEAAVPKCGSTSDSDGIPLDVLVDHRTHHLALGFAGRNIYESDIASSKALLEVGETVASKSGSLPHTAALAMVTSAIINHDEAYMKR